MSDENSLVNLNQIYKDIPIIQQLISALVAALSCVDPKLAVPTMAFYGISVLVDKLKVRRTKTFFDELAKGRISLTPELMDKNEFLHCFFSTYSAAISTYRKEKIEFFARLLINGINEGLVIESRIDEYEKYLKILDELEYSEMILLLKMYELEIKYPCKDKYIFTQNNEVEKQNAQIFSKELREFFKENNSNANSLESSLKRIERTGCFIGSYTSVIGANNTYSSTGELTILFRRLKELIQEIGVE